jgi:S-adenosylmethionine hydrolase
VSIRYHRRVSIVTLLTDFGTRDGYPGAMKGVILSRAPDAHLVDITHDVPRHDVAAGAFALAQAAPLFPPGTIHVAVVDPGVGSDRRALVVEHGGQLYIAPDNGLLSMVAPSPAGAWAIEDPRFLRQPMSTTFHGRDVFAASAGVIAAGARPEDAGPEAGSLIGLGGEQRVVVHVDGFGNLITNIAAAAVPEGATMSIGDHRISGLSVSYASVDVGELVAYIGSGGTVEIAVREGSAADVIGAGRGSGIVIETEP